MLRVLLLLMLASLGFVAPVDADPDIAGVTAAADTAHVVYRTSDLVYVNVGRKAGLEPGQTLRVERDGVKIASIRVEHLASNRAACSILDATLPPETGDVVRFDATRPSGPQSKRSQPDVAPGSRGSGSLRSLGIRGRLGARYFALNDRMAGAAAVSQPALDVRLFSDSVAGGPLGIQVDARARRTYRTRANGSTDDVGRTRVYRMSATYRRDSSPWRFTLGRQVSPDLASVSLFDGILGEYERSALRVGAFVGTAPDESSFGVSTETVEAGAYVRRDYRREERSVGSVAAGVVTSAINGEPHRDYLFLRGLLQGRRWRGFLTQELDVNRGWKRDAGEPVLSPSSTHAGITWQASPVVSVQAGFDNRRNLRLYRDRITPETEFDDSYRQGISGGIIVSPLKPLRVSASARVNLEGSDGSSESYTLTARANQVLPLSADASTRTTYYRGDLSRGWIQVVTVGLPVGREDRISLHAGLRDEERRIGGIATLVTRWFGADLDLRVGGGWYAFGAAEVTRGDSERSDQIYAGLTYRF